MTDHEEHPLDPLSAVAAPRLDPVTRDRLEAGLRVQHAEQQRTPARRGLPRWAVLAPMAALVLVATLALVLRDEAAVAALELRDARDVTVTLPDGEVVVDPADGFALIDGAVVVVGADGQATIDDITLDAGAVVTVRDGRLVTDVVATTTTDRPVHVDDDEPPADDPPADVRTTTTTSPAPADSRPADQPPRDDTAPGVTPRDDGPRDVEPEVTTTNPAGPPQDTRRPPGDGSEPTPPADPSGMGVEMALRVTRGDSGIRVVWHTEGVSGNEWRVIVVRTADGSEPIDEDSGVVIGEGFDGAVTERRDDLPELVEGVRYRVIIVDQAGGVVARGAVQTLASPGS